jgi:hypothetical protein
VSGGVPKRVDQLQFFGKHIHSVGYSKEEHQAIQKIEVNGWAGSRGCELWL